MANVTLTSPDLAVGEQLQVQIVNGDGVIFLTIIGAAGGGGGGTVTDVTGTDPIVVTNPTTTPNVAILPATDADAGSMSAADKAKLDAIASGNLWPFDTPIPAAAVNPELAQAQAVAGGGQNITVRTQAAAASSGAAAGNLFFTVGKGLDGLITGTVLFGSETVVGGSVPPTTNYFGALDLTWHESNGVVIANFGRGTDGIGGGVAGVEISAFVAMSLATEGNASSIALQPASAFGGQSFFSFQQDAGSGLPILVISKGPSDPAAGSGILRFAWDNSTSGMGLIVQRDVANSTDLSIVSRAAGVLTFGSQTEAAQLLGLDQLTYKLSGAGAGHVFEVPNGTVADFAIDAHATWTQGTKFPIAFDSWEAQLYESDTATAAAGTVIATIPLPPGTQVYALSQLEVKIQGLNPANGDFACFTHEWSFTLSGGVVTAPTGAQPAAVDRGHSAGAGTAIVPQFAVSGSNVTVTVTPWTASPVHWTTRAEINLNAGQPPNPTAPPGAPVFWARADLQGLGPAATMIDQSGSGHTLGLQGSTVAAVVTAAVGPGGTLPAYVLAGNTLYTIASALGLGTENYTIALVVQYTVPATAQVAVSLGDTASGQLLGVGTTGKRAFTQSGVVVIEDGAATSAWESWIFSSDAAGNMTLLVNGANVPVSPSTSTANPPSANFSVGSFANVTAFMTGAIFEVIAYDTIENGAAIYTYVHGVTGL